MAGWHHRCNEHELGQTLGDGEGQGAWPVAVHWITKSDWVTEQQQRQSTM